ncbi:hypothetical protein [Herbihabitans rhizosphaerae]|uniref:hypothetical protein n=1 Tax=Herbihabitans rhizosphaerae TaxID=1872711 RepID=UPI0013EEC432|nr:hypothetical protein [Herbihabitans rhizosphaerae]
MLDDDLLPDEARRRCEEVGQFTEAVRTRMRRQQVLFEPGRSIEILMSESALVAPDRTA